MTLTDSPDAWSIGHSTQEFEAFVELLRAHGIGVVADVRTSPFSRYNPQFNRRDLQHGLHAAGLEYAFLGKELGGRPEATSMYDPDGHALYGRMADSPIFKEGIARLKEGFGRYRVAIMCSEEDPAGCHRFLLITRVLHAEGIRVDHIRGSGSTQLTTDVPMFADWPDGDPEQASLFGDSVRSPWRSTRPVSPRSQPSASSQS